MPSVTVRTEDDALVLASVGSVDTTISLFEDSGVCNTLESVAVKFVNVGVSPLDELATSVDRHKPA